MTPKQILREQAVIARRSLSHGHRTWANIEIQRLFTERFSPSHRTWFVYRSLPQEVDTSLLMAQPGALLYAPVTSSSGEMQWHGVNPATRWRVGRHGVEEPEAGVCWQPSGGRVLVACPMAAFDRTGARLGLGMGCYDRWLAANADAVALRVGLAFACQEVDKVPVETHDIRMDYIVTENEVIACTGIGL